MPRSNRFQSSLTAASMLAVLSLPMFAAAAAPGPKPVEVAAGDLVEAVETLARQFGVNAIYRSEQLRGLRTDGVSGVFGIREAFEKLLEGTALNVTEEDGSVLIGLPGNLRSNRFDRGRSAARDRPTPLAASVSLACLFMVCGAQAQSTESPVGEGDEVRTLDKVVVTADGSQVELPPAYAGGQVASGGRIGLFGNLDIMDTPFNATNYTAELMQNQQTRSVADVVQNDPAVRVARGSGNFQELYMVRGLPVYSDDMGYNGLYGLLPRQYVSTDFLERVEVFRGANSFVNGAAPGGSGLGGSFNLVPKRAPDGGLTRMTLGHEEGGQNHASFDLARRLGADERFGARASATRRSGGTSVEHTNRELEVVALGVDHRGEQLRLSADLGYQNHHITAPRASVIPAAGGVPAPPDATSNYSQKWTFSDERAVFGVARGEYDFTEHTRLWAAAGIRRSEEYNVLSTPTLTDNVTGSTTGRRTDNYREDTVTTGEIGLRTEFRTGSIRHRVSTTASVFESDSRNAYSYSLVGTVLGNLYEPIYVERPGTPAEGFPGTAGGDLFNPLTTFLTKSSSFAVADTLSFAEEKVMLTLGARYQIIEQYGYNFNTGEQNFGYDDSAITPVAGLVFRPSRRYSVYANYIEGLARGDVAPLQVGGNPIANAGEVFAPFKSKQVELGTKYDRGNFGGTLAVFRINKPNSIVVGDLYRPDGEQRNQGVELSWYGEPLAGLRALGGATWMDAEAVRTQGGSNDGNPILGVPDFLANVGFEWDVPALESLTLDARAVYTSDQTLNAAASVVLPSWTRIDVGARHSWLLGDSRLTLRARIDNLTGRDYWASAGGFPGANYLVLAAPRTFTVSVSVDFL